MEWRNDTGVTEFILLGLSDNAGTQIGLFLIFFLIYLIILIGNSLIITVTITDTRLQTPMYFFLTNLSILDICYSTSIVPRMLRDFVSANKAISYRECVVQLYFALSLGGVECILLAIMAYDRYVAICYPLHYITIINRSICIKVASGTWICGFFFSFTHVALTLNLKFCESNEINHFFCEVPELLSLGCGDVSMNEFVIFVAGVIILMLPVTFIIISYVTIVRAILKFSSFAGQQKAFSTCGSHMMVVTLFYGSAMTTYMKPRSHSSPHADKMIAVFYTILTPMFNPMIYTLRNKEVKEAMKKYILKKIIFMKT